MIKKTFLIIALTVISLCFNSNFVNAEEVTGNLTPQIQTGITGVLKTAPSVSPAAGEYHATQSVTLTAAGSSAICYTVDGTTPACTDSITCATGTKYTAAISVTSTKTVKSIACYGDNTAGSATTTTYTLTCTISSVANGTVAAYSDCTITCNSGYTRSGNTCVASGGGGGSGGGGSAPPPTMPTTATGQVTATPAAGGKTTVAAPDGTGATVEIPANALTSSAVITVNTVAKTAESVAAAIAAVPTGTFVVGNNVYTMAAVSEGTIAVTSFRQTVTLTFTYTDAQIAGLSESSLKVYYWDATNSKWTVLSTTVNTLTNTITCTTNHFTYFAIIGQKAAAVPITPTAPTPQVTSLQAEIDRITALINQLQAELTKKPTAVAPTVSGIPASFKFKVNLKLGMVSDDIKYLQIVLNSDPDTKIANSGAGSPGQETTKFGSLTKTAVIKFQEKYASDVLTPSGLTKGTGLVGSATIAKLNAILAAGVSIPEISAPVTPTPQAPTTGIQGIPTGFKFKVTLKSGLISDDVKYLQIVLNSDPATKIVDSGAGSPGSETTKFGSLTKAAVIKFQEKYASEVLTPSGLAKGTGLVGSATIAKLNKLLGY